MRLFSVAAVVALTPALVHSQEPLPPQLERLRTPQFATRPAEKMLVVEAKGDPRTIGGQAFGLLIQLYFRIPETPKGAPLSAPRARWPVALDRPRSEWIGLYALPVPDAVSDLPAHTAPAGMKATLTTWDYGGVFEVLHVGPYDREEPTLQRLRDAARSQGYSLLADHEEEYIRGPGMSGPGDPEQYLTILRYRVVKR